MPGHFKVSPENMKRILAFLNKVRPDEFTIGELRAIQQFGSGAPIPTVIQRDFGEDVVNRLVHELFVKGKARMVELGITTDKPTERLFRFVADSLFEPDRRPGDFSALFNFAEFDEVSLAFVPGIEAREINIEAFPDAPLEGMQIGRIMRGLNEEGGAITDAELNAFKFPRTIPGTPSADDPLAGTPTEISARAARIFTDIGANLPTILTEARDTPGKNLVQRVRNIVEKETPEDIAAGKSVFPTSIVGSQDEAVQALRQGELEDFFDLSKTLTANEVRDKILADTRTQSLEGNFATGQELEATRKDALTRTYQEITSAINARITALKNDPEQFTDDEIKGI